MWAKQVVRQETALLRPVVREAHEGLLLATPLAYSRMEGGFLSFMVHMVIGLLQLKAWTSIY
jgi:hypothetical protein